MKKRNCELELLRFLFAVAIMIFHYDSNYNLGIFKRGHFGVEFFFVLSGILMAHSAEKVNSDGTSLDVPSETGRFLIRKIRSFYRYYIAVVLLQLVVRRIIIAHWPLRTLCKEVLRAIPEFLCIDYAGFMQVSGATLGVTWYLSVMMLCMSILYPVLLSKYQLFSKLVLPVCGLWILGILYAKTNRIVNIGLWGSVYTGVLRGAGELCLGVFCYEVAKKLRQIRFTKLSLILLQGLKIICYIVVFIYMYSDLEKSYDPEMLVFLLCGVTLSYAFDVVHEKLKKATTLFIWLGKISLPLYLIHSVVKGVAIDYMGTDIPMVAVVLLMFLSIASAVGLLYGTDWIISRLHTLRGCFIVQDEK